MTTASPVLRIGQFSESPVLAVARGLGLDEVYQLDWTTSRVPSSPAQFEWLRDDEIDIAITSPDNVMLYASTEKNPLGQTLDLRFLRTIDRGLGLALYTRPEIASVDELAGCTLGVDVMSSGFALLLLAILEELGVDASTVTFEPVGATPKRLEAIVEGAIQGSILNAEAAVSATDNGLKRWASSVDVSDNYLGTVLASLAGSQGATMDRFLGMWDEATQEILDRPADEVVEILSAQAPGLAHVSYVKLLQSSDFGLLATPRVTVEHLEVLADIRVSAGAWAPEKTALEDLVGRG